MTQTINTTTDLTTITAATITGEDGNTYTLEVRPQISLDNGLRYSVFVAETGENTEVSGEWLGGGTYSDEDNELHLDTDYRQAALNTVAQAIRASWGLGWDLNVTIWDNIQPPTSSPEWVAEQAAAHAHREQNPDDYL